MERGRVEAARAVVGAAEAVRGPRCDSGLHLRPRVLALRHGDAPRPIIRSPVSVAGSRPPAVYGAVARRFCFLRSGFGYCASAGAAPSPFAAFSNLLSRKKCF